EGSPFSGKALAYASIFAEDNTQYACNLDKAIFRLNILAELNHNRTWGLMDGMTTQNCADWKNGITLNPIYNCHDCLYIMQFLPRRYNTIILNSEQDTFTPSMMETIYNAALDIEGTARDLAKGRRCPTI
ncbi:hypothetical protein ACFL1B_06025, partial [Nanoarchaeota archaeon]